MRKSLIILPSGEELFSGSEGGNAIRSCTTPKASIVGRNSLWAPPAAPAWNYPFSRRQAA